MENLIIYIVFLVLLILGLGRKVQEQRQEEEKRRQRAQRSRPGDLPPETRRVLYGETVVREAQPKGQPPSRQFARGYDDEEDEQAAPVPPQRRPQPLQRPEPPQRPTQREDEREAWSQAEGRAGEQRSMPGEGRRQRQGMPRMVREFTQQVQEQFEEAYTQFSQEVKERKEQAERTVREAQKTAQQPKAKPKQQQRPKKAPQKEIKPPVEPGMRRRKPGEWWDTPQRRRSYLQALLRDKDSVRGGIVLREILGPPKSLQSGPQ